MKTSNFLKAGLLSLGLLLTTLPVAYAAANTDTAAENAVENTTDTAGDAATSVGNTAEDAGEAVQDTAQGFDDWGLLGLLGLLGLIGLRGGNRNVVVDGTRR